MRKKAEKEIRKINKRIEELERLMDCPEITKFITKSEIYGIVCDYECQIDLIYTREGHT